MYYFAYGSNLSHQQMTRRCPENKPMFAAILPGYKVVFTGYSTKRKGGTATIRHEIGSNVFGAVYDITDNDLTNLDTCEGYPNTYNRISINVILDSGKIVEAITYLKVNEFQETQPSKEYLADIQQGYRDWGIPSSN